MFSRLSQYLKLPVSWLSITLGSQTNETILTGSDTSKPQYSVGLTRLLGDLISTVC